MDSQLKNWSFSSPLFDSIHINSISWYHIHAQPPASPHNTGAAIDLTICDKNNNSINLGTYFDDFKTEAYTRFYEEKIEKGESLTEEEEEIVLNRRVLCNLFTEEGFVNYPYEIWHKSFGDQMSSKLLNKKNAIYGSIEIKEG